MYLDTFAPFMSGIVALIGGGGVFVWGRRVENRLGKLIQGLEDEVNVRREYEQDIRSRLLEASMRLEKALEAEAEARKEVKKQLDRDIREGEERLKERLLSLETKLNEQLSTLHRKIDQQSETFSNMGREFSELRGRLEACLNK